MKLREWLRDWPAFCMTALDEDGLITFDTADEAVTTKGRIRYAFGGVPLPKRLYCWLYDRLYLKNSSHD